MKVQEELKAYIDGELKPEEAKVVREQVEASDALAQEVAFLKLLGQEIRELVHEPAVDGATETLEAVAKQRRVNPLRIWGGAFGLAATLILIAHLPGMLAQAKSAEDSASMQRVALKTRNVATTTTPADKDSDLNTTYDGTAPVGQLEPSTAKAAAPMSKMPETVNGVIAGARSAGGGFGGSFGSSGRSGSRGVGTWIAPNPAPKANAGEYNGYLTIPKPAQDPSLSPPRHTEGLPGQDSSGFSVQAKGYIKLLKKAPAQPTRMVIQNGTLDITVANVTESQNRAINLAKGVGGFVANSSYSGGNSDADGDTPSAQIELRVPVMQFTNVMARLRGFAVTPKDIKSDQVSGNDVTGQYADDEGRLRELHAEESDYVEMLKKVRHMDDILSLKDRLSSVRQDIAGYETQVATLKDQSAMSTIDLTLETKSKPKPAAPKPHVKGWAEGVWDSAEETRSDAMKTLATLGIFLVAWSPIWLPIGIGAWWLTRKTR